MYNTKCWDIHNVFAFKKELKLNTESKPDYFTPQRKILDKHEWRVIIC